MCDVLQNGAEYTGYLHQHSLDASLKFDPDQHNALGYKAADKVLGIMEALYEQDHTHMALCLMVELRLVMSVTYCHDIYDGLGLWISDKGDVALMRYLKRRLEETNDPRMREELSDCMNFEH